MKIYTVEDLEVLMEDFKVFFVREERCWRVYSKDLVDYYGEYYSLNDVCNKLVALKKEQNSIVAQNL